MHVAKLSVYAIDAEKKATKEVDTPAVFSAPVRADIIQFAHTQLNKNHRQAYGRFKYASLDTTSHSWGVGRALARVPRVSGSGTARSGQAHGGNMCRGGRMFSPVRVTRRLYRKVNLPVKRYAVTSAIAATANPSFLLGRGHLVENVPQVPLILDNSVESITRTKDAIKALEMVGAYADCEKVKDTKKTRAGHGKWRNRRYKQRKGPMVVYAEDNGIARSFRNIAGVTVAKVDALNLLDLAPGGHMGRFVIWTEGAIAKLDEIYAAKMHRAISTETELKNVLENDAVKAALRAPIRTKKYFQIKRNGLKNRAFGKKLNPAMGK
ncbi:Ribosomal protein L4/L1e [Carpediemonas membranifera]|uniref:Large ribosomal subunit protein uL4 n=1 Tax=Carpediemonas membranifera TaxID=201153 RepID=A0A8J6E870_9EUKA|nr:Ribosomal protein L4/L1e [Carpediemonas membranifera]|eukprot:KAG9391495.1 Ribosomal protein L4/L1e [Carpediemonas membranifera]